MNLAEIIEENGGEKVKEKKRNSRSPIGTFKNSKTSFHFDRDGYSFQLFMNFELGVQQQNMPEDSHYSIRLNVQSTRTPLFSFYPRSNTAKFFLRFFGRKDTFQIKNYYKLKGDRKVIDLLVKNKFTKGILMENELYVHCKEPNHISIIFGNNDLKMENIIQFSDHFGEMLNNHLQKKLPSEKSERSSF